MMRCIHACMLIKQMTFAGESQELTLTVAEPQRIKIGDAGLFCAGLVAHGNPFLLTLDPVHCEAATEQASTVASELLRSRSREFSICAMLVLDVLPCHRVQENAQMSSAKHYIRHLLTSR